jgi:hypothetical protein
LCFDRIWPLTSFTLDAKAAPVLPILLRVDTQSLWYALENLVSKFKGTSEPTLWIDRFCMRLDKRDEYLKYAVA